MRARHRSSPVSLPVALTAVATLALLACSARATRPNASGFTTDDDGGPGGGGAPPSGDDGGQGTFGVVPDASAPASDTITITIRDFKLYKAGDPTTNPDFEDVPQTAPPWPDPGIVTDALGSDGKPVYQSATPTTLTTHGAASFDQWFRDVPGVNLRVEVPITLAKGAGGVYGYDSNVSGVPVDPGDPVRMFFPIDDGTPYATAFGNQGDPHNYSFTAEVHAVFTYRGGETFHFRGDDDVFVFIDRKRVIDLGGIHDPETGDVKVDALGLTKGSSYPLDFFFAERHKYGSNVLFTTTLELRPSPVVY